MQNVVDKGIPMEELRKLLFPDLPKDKTNTTKTITTTTIMTLTNMTKITKNRATFGKNTFLNAKLTVYLIET